MLLDTTRSARGEIVRGGGRALKINVTRSARVNELENVCFVGDIARSTGLYRVTWLCM